MRNAFGLFLLLCQSLFEGHWLHSPPTHPEAELKVVSLWNWPKQELREKNWSAMEALSATESMLQGKLSKAVKVRYLTSVCFTLVPIWCIPPSPHLTPKCCVFCHNWPSEISFLPSSITTLHTHLPSLLPLCCLASTFIIGCLRAGELQCAAPPWASDFI